MLRWGEHMYAYISCYISLTLSPGVFKIGRAWYTLSMHAIFPTFLYGHSCSRYVLHDITFCCVQWKNWKMLSCSDAAQFSLYSPKQNHFFWMGFVEVPDSNTNIHWLNILSHTCTFMCMVCMCPHANACTTPWNVQIHMIWILALVWILVITHLHSALPTDQGSSACWVQITIGQASEPDKQVTSK